MVTVSLYGVCDFDSVDERCPLPYCEQGMACVLSLAFGSEALFSHWRETAMRGPLCIRVTAILGSLGARVQRASVTSRVLVGVSFEALIAVRGRSSASGTVFVPSLGCLLAQCGIKETARLLI